MLTLSEYLMKEPVPLHRVHEAIFDFCRRWHDAVIFGAQAVNAHLPEAGARMTQDVDILSVHPEQTARALADALRAQLQIATRVREVVLGKGFRVYQKRESGSRHLADVRLLEFDAESVKRDGVVYVGLALLVAMKLAAATRRGNTAKGLTDLVDLRRLLAAHPELSGDARLDAAIATATGSAAGAAAAKDMWRSILSAPPAAADPEWPDDDDEGDET
jgi:hypothetical protein